MKTRFNKLTAWVLTLAMIMTFMPSFTIGASAETTELNNKYQQMLETITSENRYGLTGKTDESRILHAFGWSYENIKAQLETIAKQGFGAILVSPPNELKMPTKNVRFYESEIDGVSPNGWWMLYHPAGFQINESEDNALGTKDSFVDMCDAAHSLGLKIMVETVVGYMGTDYYHVGEYNNTSDNPKEHTNPRAYEFESELMIYDSFHSPWVISEYKTSEDEFTHYEIEESLTQHAVDGKPDLATETQRVQDIMYDYLVELTEAGADGFYFNDAKHIETVHDTYFASDFWEDVLVGVMANYQDKELYSVGEIIGSPGDGRSAMEYIDSGMDITNTQISDVLVQNVKNSESISFEFSEELPQENSVLWTESYKSYTNGETASLSVEQRNKIWALSAARNNVTSIYFARPSDDTAENETAVKEILSGITLGDASLTSWSADTVAKINQFANFFDGADESFHYEDSVAVIERGGTGAVLVNLNGNEESISLAANTLADGKYTDALAGNVFTVADGTLSGDMGNNGIAVLYLTEKLELEHTIEWIGSADVVNTPEFDIYQYLPADINISGMIVETANILSGVTPTYSEGLAKIELTTKIFDEPCSETIATVISSSNYPDITFYFNIILTGKYIVNISAQPVDSVFDGSPKQGYSDLSGKMSNGDDYDGEYIYSYSLADGTPLETAPSAVGDYKVMIAIPDDNVDYKGSLTLEFSIIAEAQAKYQSEENGEWLEGTFEDAIENVYSGGTVKLIKNIDIDSTKTISKEMTLTAEDEANPFVIGTSSNEHGYLLNVTADVTLKNIIIDGGSKNGLTAKRALIAVNGGKLHIGSGAVVRNNNNTTKNGIGGGVCLITGELVLDGGTITGNTGYFGGGIGLAGGTFTANKGSITGNNGKMGGGVCVWESGANVGTMNVTGNVSISENTAELYAAGVNCCFNGSVTLSGNPVISGNISPDETEGGIYLDGNNNDGHSKIYINALTDGAQVNFYTWLKSEGLRIALPTENYIIADSDLNKIRWNGNDFVLEKNDEGNVILALPPQKFGVSFETNGGTSVDKQQVIEGEKVSEPVAPTKTGYIFAGWYKDINLTVAWNFDDVVEEHMTLYAKWNRRSSGGGSYSNTTTTTTKNEDGSTTKTTTNKSTGTVTEVTTWPDGSSKTVETKKDGTVTTIEKDKEGNTTTTVEKPDGTSTTTEKNKDGSEKVTEEKADGTTVTTEKDTDGTKTVTTENPDGSTITEETKKDGTKVTTETNADGETTAEVEAKGETEVVIPVDNAEDVASITVTDKDGKETEITDFEITEDGVKVTVSGDCTAVVNTAAKKEFADVHPVNHWATADIDYAYIKGLMMGTSETHFSPDVPLTRAMLVTVLYRLEGEPEMKNAQWFEDVEKGLWYSNAVAWATFNGITMGYGNGNFGPDDYITREQIAAIMHRYAQYKDYDVTQGGMLVREYDDYEAISDYALSSMTWAVNAGILKGKGNNSLAPQDNATRAEVAAILHRFIEANK